MRILHILAVLMNVVVIGYSIELDLTKTQASISEAGKILIRMSVTDATSPYTISYLGLPLSWEVKNNDLILSNFTLDSAQQWTFDILIKDANGSQLFQTVKMILNGYQIQFVPVTLGVNIVKNNTVARQSQTPNGNSQSFSSQYSSRFSFSSSSSSSSASTSSSSLFSPGAFSENGFNIKGLYQSYPGIPQNFGSSFNTKSAFGIDYGKNNSIITPLLISNAQATYDPNRDGKKITETDIKKNAAIFRQSNADKSIANLLTIIQRVNKSIVQSQNLIITYETNLNFSLNASRECSLQLFNFTNIRAKIKNALEDKNNRLKQFQVDIDENLKKYNTISVQLQALETQKLKYSQIYPEGNKLIQKQALLQQCESLVTIPLTQIEEKTANIKKNYIEINLVENQINESNSRLRNVNQSLRIVRQKITSLKSQLKKAQEEEISLVKQQSYYGRVPRQGQAKLQNFTRQNLKLSKQIQISTEAIEKNRVKCETYEKEIDNLKAIIAKKKQAYDELNQQSIQKSQQLAQISQKTKQLKQSLSSIPLEIVALQVQLDKYNLRINQQEYQCQLLEEYLAKDRKVLEDEKNNLEGLIANEKEAEGNLEKARTEKELADIAVQEIIAQTANVLPFAIVPNGGSAALGGNPLGNNPSGSALGPSFRVDANSRGVLSPYQIGNISNYISKIYGMNIDPTNLFKPTPPPPSTTPSLSSSLLSSNDPFSSFGGGFGSSLFGSSTTSLFNQPSTQAPPQQTSLAYINELGSRAILYPLDQESRSKIVSSISTTAGLSSFNCNGSNTANNLESHQGILETVNLGSIDVRDNLNQKFTISISTCTTISSTKKGVFFVPGSKVFFSGNKAYQIFGTVLFNAFTILIIPY